MARSTVNSVTVHTEGAFGQGEYNPAVNVKVYNLPWDSDTVKDHFGCSPETAQKAAETSWEVACEEFWEYWADLNLTTEYFPGFEGLKVYSEGRSAGWLTVHGLPRPVEDWPDDLVSKWAEFEKAVLEDVKYRSGWDYARELIEANEWAMDPVKCKCCGTMVHPSQLKVSGKVVRVRKW